MNKIFWLQESKLPDSKRPESKCPVVKVQGSKRLESRRPGHVSGVQASKCPESKRPDHASKVQLFRYANIHRVLNQLKGNKSISKNQSNSIPAEIIGKW